MNSQSSLLQNTFAISTRFLAGHKLREQKKVSVEAALPRSGNFRGGGGDGKGEEEECATTATAT